MCQCCAMLASAWAQVQFPVKGLGKAEDSPGAWGLPTYRRDLEEFPGCNHHRSEATRQNISYHSLSTVLSKKQNNLKNN